MFSLPLTLSNHVEEVDAFRMCLDIAELDGDAKKSISSSIVARLGHRTPDST